MKSCSHYTPTTVELFISFFLNPVIVYTEWYFGLGPLTLPHVSL